MKNTEFCVKIKNKTNFMSDNFISDDGKKTNVRVQNEGIYFSSNSIPQQSQVQYDLNMQLKELKIAANKLGLYDAADFLNRFID